MYSDISGEWPKWVLDISDWMNENPSSKMNPSNSSNPFLINSSSVIFGAVGTRLLNYYDKVSYYNVNSPAGVYGKVFGALGVGISLGGLALDIGNTWTEVNSNTNAERIMKTSLQGMKFVVEYTASYYLIGMSVAAIASGAPILSAPVILPVVALVGVFILTDCLVNESYD